MFWQKNGAKNKNQLISQKPHFLPDYLFVRLKPICLIYVSAKQKELTCVTKDLLLPTANQNYGNYGEITALRRHCGITELRILKTAIRNNYGYGKSIILWIWQTTIFLFCSWNDLHAKSDQSKFLFFGTKLSMIIPISVLFHWLTGFLKHIFYVNFYY